MRNSFGHQLQLQRINLGMTQGQVAEQVGFKNKNSGIQTIARIEQGKQSIPRKKIMEFANIYKINAKEIFSKMASDYLDHIQRLNMKPRKKKRKPNGYKK